MSDPSICTLGTPGRTAYRLRVEGRLDEQNLNFADVATLALAVTPTVPAVTVVTCALPDQGALVRLVNRLHHLGLPLVSVERLDPLP